MSAHYGFLLSPRLRFPAMVSVLALGAALLQGAAATAATPTHGHGGLTGAPLQADQPLTQTARQRLRAQARQGASGLQEITSLRTRTSDTYQTPSGAYQTVVSAGSMNYQDASGAWQPIDDTLVPSAVAGYAYQNKANAYTVLLPASLGGAPVKVTAGSQWVSYSLAGASGPGTVSGATDTFTSVLPGVNLSYTAEPDQVKEAITLTGPAAPVRFSFHVQMSPGLSAQATAGGVSFSDSSGHTVLQVPAPVVVDASGSDAASSAAVSLASTSVAGGLTVTVAVDPAWLAAAGRVWPVTIDPSTVLNPSQDCAISEATPTTSYCTSPTMTVGSGSNLSYTRRALVQFNLSSISADAQVVDADLALYLSGETTTHTSPLEVRQLSHSWTNSATWNSYDGTHPWDDPGGDFTSTQFGTNPTVGGTVNTWVHFDPTALVQNWVDDPTDTANDGLVVKEPTEHTINNEFQFSSSEGTNPPTLTVTWMDLLGQQRWYKLETRAMDDRIGAGVNVVSGNLVFAQHDVKIAGTAGLGLVVDRYWNSQQPRSTSDNGWRFSVGPDVHLQFLTDGSVAYHGVSGYVVGFPANSSGGFDKPPGFDGTLAKDGSTYNLTFNSGEVYVFNSSGQLITDQSPRSSATTIGFAYRSDGTLSTVTDSQNRTVSFTYNAAGSIKQVSESNGPTTRTWTYGYNSANQLSTYTDPFNTVPTQYGYNSNGDLNQVTDPAGNVMFFVYTCSTCDQVKTVTMGYGTPQAATWTFTYNSGNTVVNDPNNHNTTYFHNGGSGFTLNEVNKVTDANGHTQSTSYDSNYNVATLTDANSPPNSWTTTFSTGNTGGDLTGATLPTVYGTTGANESWGYTGPPHYPTSFTGFDGQKYTYGYGDPSDPALANDLTSLKSPFGNLWQYGYYHDGNLHTVTDPNNNTTTFTETGGNITQITPPSVNPPLGPTKIVPDGLSRITKLTDGKNQLTKYSYDTLDRLSTVTFNDGTVIQYNYTPDDLVQTVQVNNSTVESFTYNSLNQMTSKTVGKTTVQYGFDGIGNLTSFTDDNGQVSYFYDPANNLTKLTGPGGTPVINFAVSNDNLRTSATFPSSVGVTTAAAYDKANRPCLIVAAPTANIPSPLTCSSTVSGALTSYTYSYQDPGSGSDTSRIQSVTNNVTGKTTMYHYSADGELCWAYVGTSTNTCPNPPAGATGYNYDPAGNITSVTENGSTTTLAYNAADILCWAYTGTSTNGCGTPPGGATTYTYDGDGNITGASNGLAIAYNALNQATSTTPPGGSTLSLSYIGAGQNQLSQAGSDTLVNTLLGVSSKTDGNKNTTFYVRDNAGRLVYEQVPAGTKYYYLADAIGSIVGLVKPDGTLAGGTPYAYDPYGNLTQGQTTVDNPWLFQGQYSLFEDQGTNFGLYHMGARYYQPSIQRWTQPDPTGLNSTKEPLEQNPYLFASADPINNTDPTGRQICPAPAPAPAVPSYVQCYICILQVIKSNSTCAGNCFTCAITRGFAAVACGICALCIQIARGACADYCTER
jgi:RHS repeat-associated protein